MYVFKMNFHYHIITKLFCMYNNINTNAFPKHMERFTTIIMDNTVIFRHDIT